MSTLVNELKAFSDQPELLKLHQKSSQNISGVCDTEVDLEYIRKKIWNRHDKLMHFAGYYGDTKVKPPFSLYYQMLTNNLNRPDETLNLKITTTLKRCWGSKCQTIPLKHSVRQTPYVWWLNWNYLKYRICFECLNPQQIMMLELLYSVKSSQNVS